MNRKYFIYLASATLITAIILFNNKEVILSSHKSGFYLKPFKLSLTTNNKYTIHYTVDGSNPSTISKIFENPLMITGMESYDSLSFINTTIADSIANFGWREPIGNQDKATIIKYAAFQNGSIMTDIKTLSFFVGYNWYYNVFPNTNKNKILNKINSKRVNNVLLKVLPFNSIVTTKYKLPIISISTHKRNLYSKDKGLFIAGDNFIANKKHSGNFFKRGKEFEREVCFQYFNKNGVLEFEQNIGMRIHGGITRRNPQKSLKFYAREEYGEKEVNFPFLDEQGVNRFILESMQESGGGQALIEDVVAQEIIKNIGLEQQNFQAAIVFINGEYWGLHTIRDRVDENYLAYKFNIPKDSFDIIDGNPSTDPAYEIIHGENSDYIDLISFIKENNLSVNRNYSHITSKIDIDNFIDYYSVEIFFANNDWPIHNTKIWRKKNGKWRFLLYDLDGGFTSNNRDHTLDMFSRLSNEENCGACGNSPNANLLFRSLMKNTKFNQKFNARYNEIIRQYMNPDRTLAIVDSITEIYHTNMQDHINRWRYPWSLKHHWERDIENNIKEFLKNREDYTLRNLNNYIKRKKSND